jgi:arylsulfatase A-like enzyme
MDRLAREGVRFTSAYTQNPICTPSRVSIFSGQYCHNHGYYGLSGPRPLALPSFMSHFRDNGYRTAGIGNLHTPNAPRDWLEGHLDLYDDTFASVDGRLDQSAWYDDLRARGLYEIEDFRFGDTHPEYFLEGMPSRLEFEDSQEGWCVRSAIRFMEECGDRPFCMQVSLERPHQVFYPNKRFWDMYPEDLELPPTLDQDPSGRPPHFRAAFEAFRRVRSPLEPRGFHDVARRLWRGYLACVTHVDHALGLLLEHLDRTGLADRTIVIYHADHGGYSGTHGIQEKAPGICSEAVCRVPFLWRVPGLNPEQRGAIRGQLAESVDIAPTISSLCGLPAMPSVDGHDLSGILRGGEGPVREVAVTEHPWSKALRFRQWRFVHYQRGMFGSEDVGELYDLSRDRTESRNLYNDPDHQGIVHECRRRLLEWLIGTSRVATVWPAIEHTNLPYDYRTAGDGKEANTAGPALRVERGQLNYV